MSYIKVYNLENKYRILYVKRRVSSGIDIQICFPTRRKSIECYVKNVKQI